MNIVKRNGEKEPLDYQKINQVLIWAAEKVKNVSASQVAMNAKLKLTENIATTDIHKILIQSAVDLISETEPNYTYVACNLLNFYIRKNVFNAVEELPHIKELIKTNVDKKIYDTILIESYTDKDYDIINGYIKHDRDYEFTWAGLQQLVDKYLCKDRIHDILHETPQYAYMCIAMTLFANHKPVERLKMIKTFYDMISKGKISLPTPIILGVRTSLRQYSSCTLISVGDTIGGINSALDIVGRYTASRAGIGLNLGRIRSIGDPVRNNEIQHAGVIPVLRSFQDMTRQYTQSVRSGCLRKDTNVTVVENVTINGQQFGINDTIIIDNDEVLVSDFLKNRYID
jgi:ribonucleoside-diphosphate reductase alpha chain